MKDFDQLWREVQERCQKYAIPCVQDYKELQHVYNMMWNCESYLEIGSAEGNSLHVLGHAVKPNGHIAYVDYGETHTTEARNEVIGDLRNDGYKVDGVLGDSTKRETLVRLLSVDEHFYPDVVMIDAGHDVFSVMSDAIQYAPRARKYVFFHDIQIPDVKKAFEWYAQYAEQNWKSTTFVNNNNYGYGILTKRF